MIFISGLGVKQDLKGNIFKKKINLLNILCICIELFMFLTCNLYFLLLGVCAGISLRRM